MKNKKAAMEMSVGTIVTIVLLMSVLVLGIVLVQKIFKGATESVGLTETAVKNEINKLFSEQTNKKVILVPESKRIIIKKGEDDLGFGISIRNIGSEDARFSYDVSVGEVSGCSMDDSEAEDLISLGRKGDVNIPAGDMMDDAIFVRFNIPETTPPCEIRYSVAVEKDNGLYGSSLFMDLVIKPE